MIRKYLRMKRIITIVVFAAMSCHLISAKPVDDIEKIKVLEDKCSILQNELKNAENKLHKLTCKQKEDERKIQSLNRESFKLCVRIDSLQNECNRLADMQTADRKEFGGRIDETNGNVQTNMDMLQSRTLWIGAFAVVILVVIAGIAYWMTRRIKYRDSSIDEVRRAQETLQSAQTKMQEESVKLDNQLLAIVQKQLDASVSSANKTTGEPDHSLVVKLADEIARIETNLSKMDKSVRGYKQLVQAKDRMINNVRANGYEIISLLGQEYNDGMQFQTRFVPDESLPEGKRIITGMIKMQVNYNGKMIQPAEIVVSQNI